MSAYITTNFSSPKTLQTACTDSSENLNVLLSYVFANHDSTTLSTYVLAKVQQTINIKMENLHDTFCLKHSVKKTKLQTIMLLFFQVFNAKKKQEDTKMSQTK